MNLDGIKKDLRLLISNKISFAEHKLQKAKRTWMTPPKNFLLI
jgi:hypothetical protein